MTSDIQKNQGSPAKPGVDSHDPENRDPNNMMEHVKVRNKALFTLSEDECESDSRQSKESK